MTTGILEHEPTISSYTSLGQSTEAKHLQDQIEWTVIRLQDPVEYVEPCRRVFREMEEVFLKCQEDDWDGYGAKGASLESFEHAHSFVLALPAQCLDLEVGVDPDGEFSFDWFGSRGAVLTISVGPNGQLTYAGRFGLARAHGLEFLSEAIPKEILRCLSRLT